MEMGIGHVSVGFAAKRLAPRTSLGLLILAGLFVDVVWTITVGLGLEHVRIVPGYLPASPFVLYDYPITHSMVGSLAWAVAFGTVYFAFRRDRAGALVLAACVFSHWILDVVAHRPDMPVLPDGPYLGLGMWYSLSLTLVVEAALVAAGAALYLRSTRGRDRIGTVGLAVLLAAFLVFHLVGYLGPPPSSVQAIPVMGAFLLLPVLAAHWIDRHRAMA